MTEAPQFFQNQEEYRTEMREAFERWMQDERLKSAASTTLSEEKNGSPVLRVFLRDHGPGYKITVDKRSNIDGFLIQKYAADTTSTEKEIYTKKHSRIDRVAKGALNSWFRDTLESSVSTHTANFFGETDAPPQK